MTKTNKKALFGSVIALVLCFTMLLGTTFAWFTDSATSSGNKIQSGTLKVDLEVLEEDNQTWTSIKDSKDPIFTYDKWEPGFTQVKILRVVNEGTLALKWKAQLVSSAPLGELANVIDVYVKEDVVTYPTDRTDLDGWTKLPGTLADFVGSIETTTTGKIEAAVGNEIACEVLGIAFKMQESAGNNYQDKTLGAFDINILATQLDSESDSFGKDYDANLELKEEGLTTITTADGAVIAYTDDGAATLYDTSDYVGTSYTVPEGVTNIGGNSFQNDVTEVTFASTVKAVNENAFAYNTNIQTVNMNDGLEYIGYRAFRDCTNLKEVTLPSTVTSIDGSFHKCTNLEKINIPSSVTYIGAGSFYPCPKLTDMTLPEGLLELAPSALREIGVSEITIPSTCTKIGEFCFRGCANLTSIKILSESVTFGSGKFASNQTNTCINNGMTIYVKNDTVAAAVQANLGAYNATSNNYQIVVDPNLA